MGQATFLTNSSIVRAGWGIDSRLAAFNQAGQIGSRKRVILDLTLL